MKAYCMKCRRQVHIQGAIKILLRNGRHAMHGTCPVCHTKVYRLVPKVK